MTGRRILVVDDEQVVLDAATRILTVEGFEVIAKPDAESGLDALEADHPAVVLIDLKLPGLSGIEFLEAARKSNPDVPVIVMTGVSSVDQAVKALTEGAFDFLPKPFTFEELLGPVNRAGRYSDLIAGGGLQATLCRPDEATRRLGSLTWTRPGPEGYVIGVTDLFASTAGPLQAVELPHVGDRLHQGGQMARLESTDGRRHWVLSPLCGTVVAVNESLQTSTDILNNSPCDEGWIAIVHPSELESDLANLV